MSRDANIGLISTEAQRVKIIFFGLASLRLAYLDLSTVKIQNASVHKINNKYFYHYDNNIHDIRFASSLTQEKFLGHLQ